MATMLNSARHSRQSHVGLRIGTRHNPNNKPVVSAADRGNINKAIELLEKAKRETNPNRVGVHLTEAYRLVRNVTRDYITQ